MLFTLVSEYTGGTYVLQTRAKSLDLLLLESKEWLGKLIDYLNLEVYDRQELINQLSNELSKDSLESISGLTNTWCLSSMICNKLLLLTVICTIES